MPEIPKQAKEAFNAVKNLLVPHMEDLNERSAFVRSALYGCPVLEQIDWSGSSSVFTAHLIEKLLVFGECQQGHSAIVLLLQELKSRTGIDKHTLIDHLIEVYKSDLEINQTTKSTQEVPLISSISRFNPSMHAPQDTTPPEQRRNTTGIELSTPLQPKFFNVHKAIEHFHNAVDAKEWDNAQNLLNEIRRSGTKIPSTFNFEAHEKDVRTELEYNIVRRMVKSKKPNFFRAREALQAFHRDYPYYDPDHLSERLLLETSLLTFLNTMRSFTDNWTKRVFLFSGFLLGSLGCLIYLPELYIWEDIPFTQTLNITSVSALLTSGIFALVLILITSLIIVLFDRPILRVLVLPILVIMVFFMMILGISHMLFVGPACVSLLALISQLSKYYKPFKAYVLAYKDSYNR